MSADYTAQFGKLISEQMIYHETERARTQSAMVYISGEIDRAYLLHPRAYVSVPEADAVLQEEIDELFDAIKAGRRDEALAEAVQVAAVALRTIIDLRENHCAEPGAMRDNLCFEAASELDAVRHSRGRTCLRPLNSMHEFYGELTAAREAQSSCGSQHSIGECSLTESHKSFLVGIAGMCIGCIVDLAPRPPHADRNNHGGDQPQDDSSRASRATLAEPTDG